MLDAEELLLELLTKNFTDLEGWLTWAWTAREIPDPQLEARLRQFLRERSREPMQCR